MVKNENAMRWHDKIKQRKRNRSPIAELPSIGQPTNKPVRVKQVRSAIGNPKDQGATLKCLGLGKIGAEVERIDTPTTHGMLFKVRHLIQITPVETDS